MPETMPTSTVSPQVEEFVPTGADIQSPMNRTDILGDQATEKWRQLIDHKFIEWGRNPKVFEDDDIQPPSGAVIQRAIRLAEALKKSGVQPPSVVVPDPNGGIVFEYRQNGFTQVFHIWEDSRIDYCLFSGTRLTERHAL
jgi:hypothetical protein